MTKVLFICTANTCRSAMAEYILRDKISKRGLTKSFKVKGAGIFAVEGDVITATAHLVLKELGIKGGEKHKATPFNLSMIKTYDYIITATREHKKYIGNFPNVYSFAELSGGGDIIDPWGGNLDTYRAIGKELSQKIEEILDWIIADQEVKSSQGLAAGANSLNNSNNTKKEETKDDSDSE